jgi:hypothetical protein
VASLISSPNYKKHVLAQTINTGSSAGQHEKVFSIDRMNENSYKEGRHGGRDMKSEVS